MRRSLFAPVILGLLCGLLAQTALAAERTVVLQSDLTVPILGTRSVGVLTVVYDDATGEGTWTFDGAIDGAPASSSGHGRSVVTGDDTFELTMTSIDTWQMPGFDPDVPRRASIRAAGAIAYVNYDGPVFSLIAIPVAIDPQLTFPIEGVYVLTNAGTGAEAIEEIPMTGVGPTGLITTFDVLSGALMAVAVVLLVVTLVAGQTPSRLRRIVVREVRTNLRDVD